MIKNLFKILFITLFIYSLSSKTFAAVEEGPATEYKVIITKIELCESGSSLTECINPVTVSSGAAVGSVLDIAGTNPGESAGTLGNFGLATPGKSYTFLQATMDREITITGDSGNCTTSGGNGTLTTPATGGTGTAASKTFFVPVFSDATNYPQVNGVKNSDGSGGQDAPGNVTAGNSYFESREALTKPFTLTQGQIPTIFMAFSTATAVTHADNGTCGNAAMYATPPTVTITIE